MRHTRNDIRATIARMRAYTVYIFMCSAKKNGVCPRRLVIDLNKLDMTSNMYKNSHRNSRFLYIHNENESSRLTDSLTSDGDHVFN